MFRIRTAYVGVSCTSPSLSEHALQHKFLVRFFVKSFPHFVRPSIYHISTFARVKRLQLKPFDPAVVFYLSIKPLYFCDKKKYITFVHYFAVVNKWCYRKLIHYNVSIILLMFDGNAWYPF